MKKLVILRPERGAKASAEAARQKLGLDPIAIPLFEVRPIPWEPLDASSYDGIVATSANAFRLGGENLAALTGLPVHAVGDATAEAAREAGFTVANAGSGNAEDLSRDLPEQKLLHLAGREHIAIPGTDVVVVYGNEAIDPPPPLESLPGNVVAVHSPRAGKRLAELVDQRGEISIAAISDNAAEACGTGWQAVEVATAPRDWALLVLAEKLCQNPG